jgi:hypothetical protein
MLTVVALVDGELERLEVASAYDIGDALREAFGSGATRNDSIITYFVTPEGELASATHGPRADESVCEPDDIPEAVRDEVLEALGL